MYKQRVQKLIAQAGICSRRQAEELIRQNRITVNGELAQVGDKANHLSDEILFDGSPIRNNSTYKVYLLNKPVGVISTCSDPYGRRTIIDILPKQLQLGMHTVGRLDLESRGAILLTNHGELTLKLTHPRYKHNKTYEVWVEGRPSKSVIRKWENGVYLDGKITIKTNIEILKSTEVKALLKINLKEGKKRQIRRIAEQLGHPVIDLKRIAISTIKLGNLQEGEWRRLDKREWAPLLYSNEIDALD